MSWRSTPSVITSNLAGVNFKTIYQDLGRFSFGEAALVRELVWEVSYFSIYQN
jgi:hypothetical protein